MSRLLRWLLGACGIVAMAAAIGLTSNAIRSDGLPLIRKPLGETRGVVKREQFMATPPIHAPEQRSTSARSAAAPKAGSRMAPPAAGTTEQPSARQVKPATAVVSKPIPRPPKARLALQPASPGTQMQPPHQKIQALFTNLKDAKACFDNKTAIFLDARAVEDYRAEHIAGALWLGFESFGEDYHKVLGKMPKDRLLVTYCSDQQCSSAIKLADELVARGHTRVVIMLEGLPGWKGAGYPTASGAEAGG